MSICTPKYISKHQQELFEFISSITECYKNHRGFKTDSGRIRELDIYIPSKNLAIEFDGLYWLSYKTEEDEIFHLESREDKEEICKSNNIQLMTIYKHKWDSPIKKRIWLS